MEDPRITGVELKVALEMNFSFRKNPAQVNSAALAPVRVGLWPHSGVCVRRKSTGLRCWQVPAQLGGGKKYRLAFMREV